MFLKISTLLLLEKTFASIRRRKKMWTPELSEIFAMKVLEYWDEENAPFFKLKLHDHYRQMFLQDYASPETAALLSERFSTWFYRGCGLKPQQQQQQQPQQAKPGCQCRAPDSSDLVQCEECERRVCSWCRIDSYHNDTWVMSSCDQCLFITAHGIPVRERPPPHCGPGYFKAWQRKEADATLND